MNISNNHLVILAGGSGTRLWPLSTHEKPKQFIDLWGCGKTLLQSTFARFRDLIPIENTWIVTLRDYTGLVQEQLPQIQPSHILAEPMAKNTAAAIAYAAWKIKAVNPQANVLVTPSDHLVTDETEFRKVIMNALHFTAETDAIVTIGIRPTNPETQFGYIKGDFSCPSTRNKELFAVDEFKEKPDVETAKTYLSQEYLWNAGIYAWSVHTIVNAYRVYQPAIASIFETIAPTFGTEEEAASLNNCYPELENISVDYALMEKAEGLFVLRADIGWKDAGTWHTLQSSMNRDIYNNVLLGSHIQTYDTMNTIVRMVGKKKVIIQGLDGYIVAENDDNILICKLSEENLLQE